MKKLLILTAIVLGAAGMSAHAQDYTLTRGLPGIVFGYPSDVPLIDDQSEVGTVVWPNLSEITYMGEYTLVAVDGAWIPERIRSSPFRRHEATSLAVDLLPGRHTLRFSYSEYLPTGPGRRTYNVSTPVPVDVEVDVEAGRIYQLRAVLSHGTFAEFTVDDDLTDPKIADRLAQARSINRLAYTPLAGGQRNDYAQSSRRTVEPAAPRRTVEPAAPRRTVEPAAPRRAVEPAAPRRTVEPAAPRRTVEPAAPRRTVEPAAPRRTVEPAAPRANAPALITSEPAAPLPEGTALLHIYRVGQMGGAAVGFDVKLDDEVLYRARNNSAVTIPLSGAGAISLWAKTESRVDLPLDIEPGGEYWVRCGIRMGAFVGRPTLEIVDAAIGRSEMGKIPAARTEPTPAAPISIGPLPLAAPPAAVTPEPALPVIEPVVPEPAPVIAPVEPVVPAAPVPPAPASVPEPTRWEALSSGWEGENFTAIFEFDGPTGTTRHKWKYEIKPPFPHTITGLDDSYVQTAIGILTVDRDAAAGVEWLLRAARQDQPDAILLLSIVYANRAEVRNTAEAERWLRRGMELGLADAETKLNELLAGKTVGTSFTVSNGYNFGSRLME